MCMSHSGGYNHFLSRGRGGRASFFFLNSFPLALRGPKFYMKKHLNLVQKGGFIIFKFGGLIKWVGGWGSFDNLGEDRVEGGGVIPGDSMKWSVPHYTTRVQCLLIVYQPVISYLYTSSSEYQM